jgi:hypothetical protein
MIKSICLVIVMLACLNTNSFGQGNSNGMTIRNPKVVGKNKSYPVCVADQGLDGICKRYGFLYGVDVVRDFDSRQECAVISPDGIILNVIVDHTLTSVSCDNVKPQEPCCPRRFRCSGLPACSSEYDATGISALGL